MADGSVGEAVRASILADGAPEAMRDFYRERYYEASRRLSEAKTRVRALEGRLVVRTAGLAVAVVLLVAVSAAGIVVLLTCGG
jgi:hypothetical protein